MSDTKISAQRKEFVAERASHCCEYCLSQVEYCPDPFTVDHILPRSQGGTDDIENLAFACIGCNGRKFTAVRELDPVTGVVVPLFNPRMDKWPEHFAWNADFSMLIGLTPVGRATIERLQLNREGVINLRLVLSRVDRHPPLHVLLSAS